MTQHRNLDYGDRFPEAVSDALQEYLSTLLVNFRLSLANDQTIQVVAGVDNDQVGAGISGLWRYIRATVNAAHPGGAAGQYDVWLTTGPNVFTPSGLPPGEPPEIDDTVYDFALTIRAQGSPPPLTGGVAARRKIAEATWDGTKITRITMTSGSTAFGGASIGDFVAVTPESAARNRISPSGDFVPLAIRRRASGDVAHLFDIQDDTGAVIASITRDGLVVPRSMLAANRDALPAGRRPPGGIVWISDLGQHQTNVGSDSTPIWSGIGGQGPGQIIDFCIDEDQLPARVAPADGRLLDKVTEQGLWLKLSKNNTVANPWDTFGGLPAPPTGKYRAPDLRGRGTIGKNNMGTGNPDTPAATGARVTRVAAGTLGALTGEELHALTLSESALHDHGGATGTDSPDHTHSGTTGIDTPDHAHSLGGYYAFSSNQQNFTMGNASPDANVVWSSRTGQTSGALTNHTHGFTTGGRSVTHTHTIPAQGGGGAHENVHPVAVVVKAVTL